MSKNLKNQYANFLDAVEKVVANAKTRKSLTSFPDDVMTGFRHLDKILCGFQRGEVIVIGGKPKMGKNALALSIVSNLCKKGMPVLLFSLMDTKTMVATKMMASQCMITINNLLQGNLVEEEWVAFEQNAGKLSDYPLIINDENKLDITDIEDEVTRAVKKFNLALVVIDCIQFIRNNNPQCANRYEQLAEITRDLKTLARQCNIPILVTSQMNRKPEEEIKLKDTNNIQRPTLSQLRDSGTIESDADIIMLVHRPECYHIYNDDYGNDLSGKVQVFIDKNNRGQKGEILLNYKPEYAHFDDEFFISYEELKLKEY